MKSVEVFGKPFVVDWKSDDNRVIANQENGTSYRLVSFQSMSSEHDDVLRRGLPPMIEWCWIANPDYERNGPLEFDNWHEHRLSVSKVSKVSKLPPEALTPKGGYLPPEAAGLPLEPDSSKKTSKDTTLRFMLDLQVLAIVKEVFRNGRDEPNPHSGMRLVPGIKIPKATCQSGAVLYLKEVVPGDAPNEARMKWQMESQAKLLSESIGKIDLVQKSQTKRDEPSSPMEINATNLWFFQNEIMDKLDNELKQPPTASLFFVRYCRDRMKQVEMRKKFGWNPSTLKLRKAALKQFFSSKGVTLEMFFVNRSVFNAAEQQAREHRAKFISIRAVGECESEAEED